VPYSYVANGLTDVSAGTIALDVRDQTFAEAGMDGRVVARFQF
jgi:hypothetical protein